VKELRSVGAVQQSRPERGSRRAPGSGVGEPRPALQLDTGVPALVLRLHPLHHGGLGIARTLGRAGVPVHAVRDGCFTPATTSRYLRRSFVVDPSLPGPATVERLLAIGRGLGGRVVLVVTDDASALLVAEHAAALSETFLFPAQSPSLLRLVSDKAALARWCDAHGIACPRSVCPETDEEAEAFLETAVFPLVAKVAESWTIGRQSAVKSTTIVDTLGEAMALRSALRAAGAGARLLLQEYIPPGWGQDWFFHGYCAGGPGAEGPNDRSDVALSFTGTKARSFPPYAGMTTLGRAVDDEALRAEAERLLTGLGYRGVVDLCYRFDGRDGRFKLLDFNPRVGAQFRLFESTAGVDVVSALHLDMTGRPVPRAPQAPGRVLLVESYDTLAALRYLRDGTLRFRDWRSSRRDVTERGWFAADDPAPYAAMCLRMSTRLASKAFEGLRVHRTSDQRSSGQPAPKGSAEGSGAGAAAGARVAPPDAVTSQAPDVVASSLPGVDGR
jgi:predicted ATP-grasp superfamily ATP-dependent carboligase